MTPRAGGEGRCSQGRRPCPIRGASLYSLQQRQTRLHLQERQACPAISISKPCATKRGCASPNSAASSRASSRIRRIIPMRSEEHTSELQSLMRISYAVFCLKKKKTQKIH